MSQRELDVRACVQFPSVDRPLEHDCGSFAARATGHALDQVAGHLGDQLQQDPCETGMSQPDG